MMEGESRKTPSLIFMHKVKPILKNVIKIYLFIEVMSVNALIRHTSASFKDLINES